MAASGGSWKGGKFTAAKTTTDHFGNKVRYTPDESSKVASLNSQISSLAEKRRAALASGPGSREVDAQLRRYETQIERLQREMDSIDFRAYRRVSA